MEKRLPFAAMGAEIAVPRFTYPAGLHSGAADRGGSSRFNPMTTITAARSYQDLLGADAAPAPYEYATIFAGEGWRARRQAKRRFQLLQKLDPKLRQILRPEERVFFATAGSTMSVAEHFFVGWAAYYLNRRALVFTTERVLLVQIDSRRRPRELVSQIRYDQIEAVRATWNGLCQLKLGGGEKLGFQGVPSAERKFLRTFLADVVRAAELGAVRERGRVEHLCPSCFAVVPGHPAACQSCGAGLKSPTKAMLLSLAFPGLGDFYLGHRGFAVMELLGSAFFWFALVISPLLSGGVIDEETGEMLALGGGYWGVVAVFIFAIHGIDAAMTRHFAHKGHHPA